MVPIDKDLCGIDITRFFFFCLLVCFLIQTGVFTCLQEWLITSFLCRGKEWLFMSSQSTVWLIVFKIVSVNGQKQYIYFLSRKPFLWDKMLLSLCCITYIWIQSRLYFKLLSFTLMSHICISFHKSDHKSDCNYSLVRMHNINWHLHINHFTLRGAKLQVLNLFLQ